VWAHRQAFAKDLPLEAKDAWCSLYGKQVPYRVLASPDSLNTPYYVLSSEKWLKYRKVIV
jgi:hypothetical protein